MDSSANSGLWHDDGTGWRLLAATGFPDEATLHDLVEQAPQMLPLAGSPAVVVVGREVLLGGGWADLVAIEPSGRVVLIEVKLGKNPEVRRAIVAQVLAYASALYKLDLEALERDVLGAHLEKRGHASIGDALAAAGVLHDSDSFASGLRENLASGGFRVVLVVDEAPNDLVRLVAYLEAVTDGLLIDLVTVACYSIGESKLLVPQRIEPERLPPPAPKAGTMHEGSRLTPGCDAFREAIAEAPLEVRDRLARLTDWAVRLEQEGAVNLYTRHDVRGPKHLILQLKVEKVSLLTIWGNGTATLWPGVFKRRAPKFLELVEEAIAPKTLAGQQVQVTEFSEELLDALVEAHREAATGTLAAQAWS